VRPRIHVLRLCTQGQRPVSDLSLHLHEHHPTQIGMSNCNLGNY
jgi:hypothetical protein